MKKKLIVILMLSIFLPLRTNANIICNDGKVSPSCSNCHQGCCSHHGGCSKGNYSNNNNYVKTEDYYVKSYNDTYNDNDDINNDEAKTIFALMVVGGLGTAIGANIKKN